MKRYLFTVILSVVAAIGACAQNVITDYAIAPKDTAVITSRHNALPPLGYSGNALLEVYANGPFGSAAFGACTTHGAMITERHFIGAGLGLIHDVSNKRTMVPVYAEGRIFFPSAINRIYPHIGARLGAVITGKPGTGFMASLTAAVRIPLGERLGLIGEVGPQLMSRYSRPAFAKPYRSDGTGFGITLRIGLSF